MIVLDSNVVSYIFNGNDKAEYYREQITGLRPIISFQTLEEVWYGAYQKGWGERKRNELARFLQEYEVVFPNSQLVDICARLRAERKSVGREIQIADAWIAATAILLDCPLASHDNIFREIPALELVQAP